MASGTTRVDSSSSPAENGKTDEPASSARRPPRVGDYLGKHRLSAVIGRLHQEIQSLESELEELDKMEPSSAACNDVLSSMEGIPDALLPITKGPENSAWERWFQPVRSSRNRKWWSNRESSVS